MPAKTRAKLIDVTTENVARKGFFLLHEQAQNRRLSAEIELA